MLSMSDTKKSRKQSPYNRTTKTKASATKPELFGISLTRNKNNPNPILFNSVKKKNSLILQEKSKSFQYQSQTKQKDQKKFQLSIYQDLNTKVSVDYINCLHSDLLIKFGHELTNQLENKENFISQRNVSIILPSKQQRECFDKIKELIQIKDHANKSYRCMKNTEDLFGYLASLQQESNFQVQIKQTHQISDVHREITNFLKAFNEKESQLENLERQYEQFTKNIQQEEKSQQYDKEYLDSIIESLKEEITNEKKLCQRYQKEEKFLINKLYFTQKKNNDLRASSTNLKIKNTNLRDTIRLNKLNSTQKPSNSPKLHRSFSVKLQRIKKYNLEEEPILMGQTQSKQNQLIRSKSHSSLNSVQKVSYFPIGKKQTFLHQIL